MLPALTQIGAGETEAKPSFKIDGIILKTGTKKDTGPSLKKLKKVLDNLFVEWYRIKKF